MGKQKFAIGGELDLLTPAEMGKATDQITKAVIGLRQAPFVDHEVAIVAADANGLLGGGAGGAGVPVYRVPTGRRVDIQRVSLSSPAYTPAAPLTTGWIIASPDTGNGPPVYIWPGSGTTVLPSLYTDGDSAPRLHGGQRLMLAGAGLPANLEIVVFLQVRLWADYPQSRGSETP
jgi:hypothetical protein